MHASILLTLPFLLPFASALPHVGSGHGQDVSVLAARRAQHGAHFARHVDAKRAIESQLGKRKIRRRKTCPAKTTTAASASTTTLIGDNGLAHPNSTKAATQPATTTTAAEADTTTTATSAISESSAVTSTTSTTSSAPAQTSAVDAGNGGGVSVNALFPMTARSSWTTDPSLPGAMDFTSALKPLTAGKLPPQSSAPDGSQALIANFPAGTYKYSAATGAGFSFYTEGEKNGVDVSGAKDVLMSYSAYFPAGFDFVKGGKMPGLYGGTSLETAKSCSGGKQDGREDCFSARLMWRTDGAGEIYNYLPTSVQQGGGYCQTAPKSICDTSFGDSIGRGSYTWSTGKWTTVAIRVKLNDVGQANGEQQLWVDGQMIMHLTDLQLIVKDAYVYGIMAQTFFGGGDDSWASPKDQSVWFKDWSMAVLA